MRVKPAVSQLPRRFGFHRGHLGFHANLGGHDTRQVDWITTGSVSRPLRLAKNPAGFCATATLARESLTSDPDSSADRDSSADPDPDSDADSNTTGR